MTMKMTSRVNRSSCCGFSIPATANTAASTAIGSSTLCSQTMTPTCNTIPPIPSSSRMSAATTTCCAAVSVAHSNLKMLLPGHSNNAVEKSLAASCAVIRPPCLHGNRRRIDTSSASLFVDSPSSCLLSFCRSLLLLLLSVFLLQNNKNVAEALPGRRTRGLELRNLPPSVAANRSSTIDHTQRVAELLEVSAKFEGSDFTPELEIDLSESENQRKVRQKRLREFLQYENDSQQLSRNSPRQLSLSPSHIASFLEDTGLHDELKDENTIFSEQSSATTPTATNHSRTSYLSSPHSRHGADFEVIQPNSQLDSDMTITIRYNFPVHTKESRHLTHIVLSLPIGYSIPENFFCSQTPEDKTMPKLLCKAYKVGKKSTAFFVVVHGQITSKTKQVFLPLGHHSFNIILHSPKQNFEVNTQQNWWLARFRFSGGHALLRLFENRRLIHQRECLWSRWRQETPCSATCNGGFDIWTRTLFSGENEEKCQGASQQKPCNTSPCSLNCQLEGWETILDCTKRCGATENTAFKIEVRRIKLPPMGSGYSCKELNPWDARLREGWSDEDQLVKRLTPCSEIFQEPCDLELGCRVEVENYRTIPKDFPWGPCPFPCGGFGEITSIVQVASGIPRWVGEQHFPGNFQMPCRADKEPLVKHTKCNVQPCDDCAMFVDKPAFNQPAKAWVFFLPLQNSDRLTLILPPGFTFLPLEKESFKKNKEGSSGSETDIFSSLSTSSSSWASDSENATFSCEKIVNSFGKVSKCTIESQVKKGKHPSGMSITMQLRDVVGPIHAKPEWFVIPIHIGHAHEIKELDFKLSLQGSNSLKEPEIFDCQFKTVLSVPIPCHYSYSPKVKKDCRECLPGSKKIIPALRVFIPSKNGGTCNIPKAERNEKEDVDIYCFTACAEQSIRYHEEGVPDNEKTTATTAPFSHIKHVKQSKNVDTAGSSKSAITVFHLPTGLHGEEGGEQNEVKSMAGTTGETDTAPSETKKMKHKGQESDELVTNQKEHIKEKRENHTKIIQ